MTDNDDTNARKFSGQEIQENQDRVEITKATPTGMEAELDIHDPEPAYEGDAEPFESEEAMQTAWRKTNEDGKELAKVDEEYRLELEARTQASMYVDGFGFSTFNPDRVRQERQKTEAQRKAEEAERKQRELTVGDYSQLQVRGEQEAKEREKANQPQGFESEAELEDAVMNPKYRTHPSYRQKVDARMEQTDWL